MNIKKTSVITLIALLSCDTFAASSIVRAGVTPLGQATSVRATPSAGNSTNRASLGIGSYYDINKLRPNRTQTSAGGSTGGSTGGSSNNVSNSALESVRQELTQELTDVQKTLTKQISDLVKIVEAKDAEIQNLKNNLDAATAEIEEIADKKYVIESDLVDRFNQIKEDAVSRAIDAVNDSSYATGSYVDQEINDLRSEITSARNAALESYAKKDIVKADIATAKKEAIETAAANVTAQEYISTATVQADINTAKNAAIADAVDQAKLAVQDTLETYATKDYVDTAESDAITAIENKNYATKDDVNTAKSAAITAIENKNYATKTDVDTAESDAIKAIEEKGYLTQTELDTLEQTITAARETALQDFATKGYVDDATNDLTDNGYVTEDKLTKLKNEITAERNTALESYVTITKAQEDAKTVKQDAADLAIKKAQDDKLFATPAEVSTAKQDAIDAAAANVTALDYATNTDVTDLSNDVTASIAGLQTAIDTTDGELDTLAQQLGNAAENALTTETVNGLIATALSDGEYINQSTLDESVGEITKSITALDEKFATTAYVDENFAKQSVIKDIQNDISGLDTRIIENETGWTTNKNTLATLKTDLTTAQENITSLQTGASGAITMDNVTAAIDTALANKKYATSADLVTSVSNIQGWVNSKGYATSDYVGTEIGLVKDEIINIKLPDYAKVATVNSLQEQLNTTDTNLTALTARTETLEGNAGGYVTNGKLADELAPYATNEALADYVTRDEIKTAFDDTKPLVTINKEGKLTFVKDNFNAAVLPNLDGYVTTGKLDEKLGGYATNNALADYVTRDEIKTAFMVPDGTDAEPKPLIKYEGEGKWTFVKDNFESAVNGVTNVANMQGLYNWFIGTGTTNGGWFTKDKNNVFTLKDGFAKSIKDLKEVGTDNSLFVQTSTLDNYATKAYVTTEVGKLPSSEKEMPEEWQKSIFGVLRPLVSEEPNGEWKFQESKFNAAVQTNLTGYVTTGELGDYAKTADIAAEYATQAKLTALETELDTDYIKTDDLAKKIVDSYSAGKLTKLPYATKSELTTEITKITPEIKDVNSLISRVDALEAYKTGDISIVAGEVAGKLIGNEDFMGQIIGAVSGDDIGTFVTSASLKTTLGDYVTTGALTTTLGSYALMTDFNNLANKFKPVEKWVKKTESDDSYTIDNGAIAKSIAGLTRSDYDEDATGEETGNELFARTTAVDALTARVGTQESKVTSLESSVTADGLKTILTTEKDSKVPLLDMLTKAANKSESEDALLYRALITNDETSKQPLLSSALVFEVGEKEKEKVPLVLSLTKEGKDEKILASQDDYTKLNSNYSTLNSNYSTLDTTVSSLYGRDGLFTLDANTQALSLNTTAFSDSMATAITTAKKGDGEEEICSTDFKANALTNALTLETCKTSSTTSE